MSRKFHHTEHVGLWEFVQRNVGHRHKSEWPGFSKEVLNHCFACEYTKYDKFIAKCSQCPLVWPEDRVTYGEGYNGCTKLYDEYLDFIGDRDFESARLLACKIRDLPVREGVETV